MVCYKDVGCFHDDGPFDYLDMLPSPPEEVNTVMLLFTKQNEEKAQIIEYNNVTTVLESNYNASLDTKLIIHGFGSSCNRVWARDMRLALLEAVSYLHQRLKNTHSSSSDNGFGSDNSHSRSPAMCIHP